MPMKLVRTGLAVCLVLALVGASGAGAEETVLARNQPDYSVYELGEMVVAGEQPGVKEVATVSSVTAEDMEATHSLTVPEALSYTPGVVVTTGRKNEPDVRIHGMDQHESLILIDGVPYYETKYGKLNLNRLPTEMIARIDVVKGAASVLYGSGAMSGVINIVTKKQGPEPSFSLSGELGRDGAYHLAASHGGGRGKFKYWFSLARRERDGWELSQDFTPTLGTIVRRPGGTTQVVVEDGGERDNSDLAQTSFWGKAGLELRPRSRYYLSAFFLDSSWGFPPSTVSERVYPNRPAFSGFARMDKYRDWGLDLSGEQALGQSLVLRGKLFYHRHEDDYVSFSDQTYSRRIAVSTFRDYFLGGALFADWRLAPSDTLRFALHYRGDSHQERDDSYLPFAECFSYTGSLAVENQWHSGGGLSLVAGVSYDWFRVTKAQDNITDRKTGDLIRTADLPTPGTKDGLNPMIGASYTFGDQTRIFASVARKTRFPTLSRLFSSRSGNPDLEPQYSTNYTLGLATPGASWPMPSCRCSCTTSRTASPATARAWTPAIATTPRCASTAWSWPGSSTPCRAWSCTWPTPVSRPRTRAKAG
jgi:iron complex outermembrane receptor protein